MKTLTFAHPTSPDSIRFNHPNTGCYVVELDGVPTAHTSSLAALKQFDGSQLPIGFGSMLGPNDSQSRKRRFLMTRNK